MTKMNAWLSRAGILMNAQLIVINSFSNYVPWLVDSEVPEYFLKPDAADSTVGSSALAALQNCRRLSLEEDDKLQRQLEETYKPWVARLMKYGGHKAKRALFLHMKSCSIQRKEREFVIRPSHHETLEGWSGIRQRDGSILEFSIPLESSPEEVGAAIRLGFMHCTEK